MEIEITRMWTDTVTTGVAVIAIFPLIGVAMALGNIFATAINNIGRNPGAADRIMPITVLGFALTEAIALFALLISFLVLFG